MSATTIFILIIGSAGVIAASGIIAVAMRRKDSEGTVTQAELDREARRADVAKRKALEQAGAAAESSVATVTMVDAPAEYVDDEPRVEISENEYGITRRKFFNRAIGAVFGLFMLQFTLASLAFMWPKLKGGFGTPIKAVRSMRSRQRYFGVEQLFRSSFQPPSRGWSRFHSPNCPARHTSRRHSSSQEANQTVSASWPSGSVAYTSAAVFQSASHLRGSSARAMVRSTTTTVSMRTDLRRAIWTDSASTSTMPVNS